MYSSRLGYDLISTKCKRDDLGRHVYEPQPMEGAASKCTGCYKVCPELPAEPPVSSLLPFRNELLWISPCGHRWYHANGRVRGTLATLDVLQLSDYKDNPGAIKNTP